MNQMISKAADSGIKFTWSLVNASIKDFFKAIPLGITFMGHHFRYLYTLAMAMTTMRMGYYAYKEANLEYAREPRPDREDIPFMNRFIGSFVGATLLSAYATYRIATNQATPLEITAGATTALGETLGFAGVIYTTGSLTEAVKGVLHRGPS